jgi:hypothetical protein
MDGKGHSMAHAKHSPKGVGTWPQVGNFAKKFQGVAFFL